MKKTILITLLVTVALAGCGTKQTNPQLRKTDLKILSPTGAPAVAMYNFVNGLTTTSSPQDGLMPFFTQDVYDIIVAPTHGGLTKIVKAGANYKIAATVTFGNFYLLSTGNDSDNTLNEGDKVLYFQKNDIPGKIFEYLYGDLNLTTYTVDAANMTAQSINNNGQFKVDESTTVQLDYIFTAEPVVSNTNSVSKIYESAREAFETKSGGKKIMQASVFVNNNSDPDKINKFLELLEDDISKAIVNANNVKKTFNLYGDTDEQKQMFGFDAATVVKAFNNNNGLGLGFLNAYENRDSIENFVKLLNPSFGDISEEVYYK